MKMTAVYHIRLHTHSVRNAVLVPNLKNMFFARIYRRKNRINFSYKAL